MNLLLNNNMIKKIIIAEVRIDNQNTCFKFDKNNFILTWKYVYYK